LVSVAGDAEQARWVFEVAIREDGDGFDFGGPFVLAPHFPAAPAR
jgi:hypothetical protein